MQHGRDPRRGEDGRRFLGLAEGVREHDRDLVVGDGFAACLLEAALELRCSGKPEDRKTEGGLDQERPRMRRLRGRRGPAVAALEVSRVQQRIAVRGEMNLGGTQDVPRGNQAQPISRIAPVQSGWRNR